MEIVVLGLNHHSAPVELRERVAFQKEQLPVALSALKKELFVSECVILSTCNRVELYAHAESIPELEQRMREFLAGFHGLNPRAIQNGLYWHRQPDSVRHLFRVAAGLDSMVIGESEILGQVREMYQQAVAAKSVGSIFNRLFQTALKTGKEVRSSTRIGQGAISISSVAVELARRIFQDISSKTILLIGAGQMGEATLNCLKGQGIRSILVANRTLETAVPLAESVGGQVVPFAQLESAAAQADIIICSTAADRFLLTRSQVRRMMGVRKQRPLFLIDISVPRNLDPQIARLENVYLYDIDDLEGIAASNLRMRLNETKVCAEIIEQELKEFLDRCTAGLAHEKPVPAADNKTLVRE